MTNVVAALAAVLCISTAAALLLNDPHSSPPHMARSSLRDRIDRSPSGTIRRTPPYLKTKFGILRSTAEGLPTQVTHVLRPAYGANWSLAQKLGGTPWPAWVVPGEGVVCLFTQEETGGAVAATCTPNSLMKKRGIFMSALLEPHTSSAASARVVMGLSPDGVRAVRIHTQGAASVTARVAANVFLLRDSVAEPAERVTAIR